MYFTESKIPRAKLYIYMCVWVICIYALHHRNKGWTFKYDILNYILIVIRIAYQNGNKNRSEYECCLRSIVTDAFGLYIIAQDI